MPWGKGSEPPYSGSSDFGKIDVRRHFTAGMLCAIAGAATVVGAATLAAPTPAHHAQLRRDEHRHACRRNDAGDPRVRIHRPDEYPAQRSGRQIARVQRLPGQEARILHPLDGGTENRSGHYFTWNCTALVYQAPSKSAK